MINHEKAAKEIAKRQRQLNRPKSKVYLSYLFFIISIIYITDEVASQIGTFMKTEIANDLMAKYGNSSVSMLNLITVLSFPVMALGVLYKPLADKFGRKPFLVLNTFGMCLGLLVIYMTDTIAGYVVGAVMIQFFVTHDMQVVYIMESAPEKHRAKIYSIIKCVAILGVMVVPLLRKLLMQSVAEWRRVYIIPALLGFAVCAVAMFLAKETDAYNIARINYLQGKTDENGTDANGGIIRALKYAWGHKQLRWIFVALIFSEIGFVLSNDYQTIMTYGYANFAVAEGIISDLETALKQVAVNEVTDALFFFPVGNALCTLACGFISDKFGRRASAITMSGLAAIFFLGFYFGSRYGLAPYAVGFLCGASVGTFWSNIDTICLMAGESTPTALRSTMLSAIYIPLGLGIGLSFGVSLPLSAIFGNGAIGWIAFALAIPGFVGDFIVLSTRVKETTAVDLVHMNGSEFETEADSQPANNK